MRALPTATVLLVLVPSTAAAQATGARNQAMGGAGVASSRPQDALFLNPALALHGHRDQGVSVTLPYFGASVVDRDELVDAVDTFQDTLVDLQTALDNGNAAAANALRPVVAEQLSDLDNKRLDFNVAAGLGVVIPMDGWALGVGARSYVDAEVISFVSEDDITTINTTNDPADLDDLESTAFLAAAGISEAGVTFARDFAIGGSRVTFGVTPKFQRVETYNYAVSVDTFDDDDAFDDFDDDIYRDEETGFNVDVGAGVDLTDNVTFGLAFQNLVSEEYETVFTSGRQFIYNVDPRVTAGVALRGSGGVLTADLDLNSYTRFEDADDSQFARLGGELDVAGWLQLRGGAQFDLEGTQEELYSAGLGLAPFETVRIELAGQYSENSVGAGIQLALTF